MKLTSSERRAIFRPNVMLQRLDMQEAKFVRNAMNWVRIQAENIMIQYAAGVAVNRIVLNPKPVRGIAESLSNSMIDTYSLGEISIQNELLQAEQIRRAKQSRTYEPNIVPFAAMREDQLDNLGSPFTPKAGLNWYKDYTLRLAGVHSVDALEYAKGVITTGIQQGSAQQVVMNMLREQFTSFSEHRLENIARTETAKIYEQARYQTMNGNEEVVGYEFAAVMDSRTSAICADRDGKFILKEQVECWLPPLHYQCLLPGTRFKSPCGIVSGLRTWYTGNAVKLVLSNGSSVSVTENHMFPTFNGFAKAKSLRKGDYIFYSTDFEGIVGSNDDTNLSPPFVEDVFSALSKASGMVTYKVPTSTEYLHGDGRFSDGYIDIVTPDSLLGLTSKPASFKHFAEYNFCPRDERAIPLSGISDSAKMLFRARDAFDSVMGGRTESEFFFRRSVSHAGIHSFTPVADMDARFDKPVFDHCIRNTKLFSDSLYTDIGVIHTDSFVNVKGDASLNPTESLSCLSVSKRNIVLNESLSDGLGIDSINLSDIDRGKTGLIEPLEIVNIEVFPYIGHVYDLQTMTTLYYCNGILSSNCRSVLLPVFGWESGIQYSMADMAVKPMDGFGSTDMVIPETARNKIFIGGIPELRKSI